MKKGRSFVGSGLNGGIDEFVFCRFVGYDFSLVPVTLGSGEALYRVAADGLAFRPALHDYSPLLTLYRAYGIAFKVVSLK